MFRVRHGKKYLCEEIYDKEKRGSMKMSQETMNLPPPPPPPTRKWNLKVIALAIICIVLFASVVGVITFSVLPLKAQITQRDATIASLNQNITELQASAPNVTLYVMQITSLEQQLSALNNTISALNDNMTNYRSIALMSNSTVLLPQQQATVKSNNSTDAYADSVPYAGFIKVQVTSTSTVTFVETAYSNFGVNFDQNITVGNSGTAAFPVLPGNIEVKLGNPDTIDASVTVTITYYY